MAGEFIEEGLRSMFLADGYLASQISTRFYDAELPLGYRIESGPAVTLQRVSGVPEYVHSGQVGQENARFQVTVHADCHLACMRVAASVKRVIREHPRGQLPGGFRFGLLQQVNEVVMGRETGRDLFAIAIDFRMTYQVDF